MGDFRNCLCLFLRPQSQMSVFTDVCMDSSQEVDNMEMYELCDSPCLALLGDCNWGFDGSIT